MRDINLTLQDNSQADFTYSSSAVPTLIRRDVPTAMLGAGKPVETAAFRTRKLGAFIRDSERDKRIGTAGERLVLAFEREELINAGRPDLAERVRHVAEIEVDGAGYDIESFTASGAKKYIEVKTTTGDKDADFFLTSNELLFSKEHPYEYYLYRVYNFDEEHRKGEFFAVGGSLDRYFRLLPIQFPVTLNLRE